MCTPQLLKDNTHQFNLKDNWHLDLESYEQFKPYLYRENVRALQKIHLHESPCAMPCCNLCQHQYMDIGCGPGNVTKEKLLPISPPDTSRIVAVDRSHRAVEYAKANFSHSRITYDVFDVEYGDIVPILERYGLFDRIYSFWTFHYVGDVAKAYHNVAELLKPGGESAVVSLIGGDVIDVWDTVYKMEEWREMINPTKLFPGMYRYDAKSEFLARMESDTRNGVSKAGLQCVSYTQYETRWKFSAVEDYLETFMASFNAYDGVPPEDYSAFMDLWIELLLQKTQQGPGGQVDVSYALEVVHAQKPRSN